NRSDILRQLANISNACETRGRLISRLNWLVGAKRRAHWWAKPDRSATLSYARLRSPVGAFGDVSKYSIAPLGVGARDRRPIHGVDRIWPLEPVAHRRIPGERAGDRRSAPARRAGG